MKTTKKSSRPQAHEIDLHGQRFDEGKEKLEAFMRDAFAKKRSPVRIIHGHGTGVMKGVAELWIANNPHKIGREVEEGPSMLIYFRF
jgi:DNA-nicking Smr family endonuclease